MTQTQSGKIAPSNLLPDNSSELLSDEAIERIEMALAKTIPTHKKIKLLHVIRRSHEHLLLQSSQIPESDFNKRYSEIMDAAELLNTFLSNPAFRSYETINTENGETEVSGRILKRSNIDDQILYELRRMDGWQEFADITGSRFTSFVHCLRTLESKYKSTSKRKGHRNENTALNDFIDNLYIFYKEAHEIEGKPKLVDVERFVTAVLQETAFSDYLKYTNEDALRKQISRASKRMESIT